MLICRLSQNIFKKLAKFSRDLSGFLMLLSLPIIYTVFDGLKILFRRRCAGSCSKTATWFTTAV